MGTPIGRTTASSALANSYKHVVKLTFAKGASLKDPARLFNSSLEGNTRPRSTSTKEKKLTRSAFKALVRQAVALNSSGSRNLRRKGSPNAGRLDPEEPAPRRVHERDAGILPGLARKTLPFATG